MAPDRESTAGAPRWVKMFGIIAIALVLLFIIIHLAGGGLDRHSPPDHQAPSEGDHE